MAYKSEKDDIFHKMKGGSVEKKSWIPSDSNISSKKKEVAKKMKHSPYSVAGIVNSLKAEYRAKGKPFPKGVSQEDL
jgi:hypothetical protein